MSLGLSLFSHDIWECRGETKKKDPKTHLSCGVPPAQWAPPDGVGGGAGGTLRDEPPADLAAGR
eukprot:2605515-Prorocentrum_lima.AAC.1